MTDPLSDPCGVGHPDEARLRELITEWRERAMSAPASKYFSLMVCADELERVLPVPPPGAVPLKPEPVGTITQLIAEGETDRAGLCTQFDGCWHCRVLGSLRELGQRTDGYPMPAVVTPPKDGSDDAIRRAALDTASRIGMFAATWPEFYAFGLAVKAAMAAVPAAQDARDDPQEAFLHPAHQVFFRAGLIACREYMARFVESESPTIAASIRANWWPALGTDYGPPRLLSFSEVTSGEFGTPAFRTKTADEVSPTQEALPVALAFLQQPILPASHPSRQEPPHEQ